MAKKAQDYKYKLPEDYVLSDYHRLKLDSLVDECGLTEIQAQRFIDLHVEITEELVLKMTNVQEGGTDVA